MATQGFSATVEAKNTGQGSSYGGRPPGTTFYVVVDPGARNAEDAAVALALILSQAPASIADAVERKAEREDALLATMQNTLSESSTTPIERFRR